MIIRRILSGLVSLTLLVAWTSAARAQSVSDEEAIRQGVADYVSSWREADVDRLAELLALDEGRVMWLSEESGKEALKSTTFRDVLSRRRPQPKYGLDWEVLSLDIVGSDLAVTKVKISRSGGHYVDLLVWHKIEEDWKIVNKTFVVYPEE